MSGMGGIRAVYGDAIRPKKLGRACDGLPAGGGAPAWSAAKPAGGPIVRKTQSEASSDLAWRMSGTWRLETRSDWFKFNGIVGLCDAASRVRCGIISIGGRIFGGPFPADQRPAQLPLPAMRARAATSGRGGNGPPN